MKETEVIPVDTGEHQHLREGAGAPAPKREVANPIE